ncbi:DUF6415 family natural product biosynthesis protein [Streptomyces poonensis]|uniref:Uncharacterized protein n=1 Tax=Streptomyces poonensis TaxID=68255 RepID=A0A918PSN2_9ACTN|nr:DUF6415 family natural product biosynthesis protein [Streptomyces poonensis]GGZ19108.1 hypothetical protein GCM10010365_44350 [Streptomyces poonensis]GLJ90695.1 hypothetical protein GCM10017589_33000 [Streptomyces poonensis]
MNATTPTDPGVKMTLRVYTVDLHGSIKEDRGTVHIPRSRELPPPSLEYLPCTCPRCRKPEQSDGAPAQPVGAAGSGSLLDIGAMRAAAHGFLASPAVPRYEAVQREAHRFSGDLSKLIAHIEQLTHASEKADVPAQVALAGVAEARRRIGLLERPGLLGEVERVKKLARSVVSLCDHYDILR